MANPKSNANANANSFSIGIQRDVALFMPQQSLRTKDGKNTQYFTGVTIGKDPETGKIILARVLNVFSTGDTKSRLSEAMVVGEAILLVGTLKEKATTGGLSDTLSMQSPVIARYNREGQFTLNFEGHTHVYTGLAGEEVVPDNILEENTLLTRTLQPKGQSGPISSPAERAARYAATGVAPSVKDEMAPATHSPVETETETEVTLDMV